MFAKRKFEEQEQVKKLKFRMIFAFSIIIVVLAISISTLMVKKTDDVLKNKVEDLTLQVTTQMKLNLNRYLSGLETNAKLVFSKGEIYKYNPVVEPLDEFDTIQKESEIASELFEISNMQNYVDFFIVYSDNRVVGKKSNGTTEIFGENIYEKAASMITNKKFMDGWATIYEGAFKRVYYVKQLNDNGILMTAVYSSEFEDIFERPDMDDGLVVRLTNSDYEVMYSSKDENEVGGLLDEEIKKRIEGGSSLLYLDDDYLITLNSSNNGWYIICSAKTSDIFSEKKEIQVYIIIIAIIAIISACVVTILVSVSLSNRMQCTVETLDRKAQLDLLTGILNKKAFEGKVENVLLEREHSSRYALILVDVDDFKKINDTAGHICGDMVLSQMGQILRDTFRECDIVGRIGGDEFCVLMDLNDIGNRDVQNIVKDKCDKLLGFFHEHPFENEGNELWVSISIGVAVSENADETFEQLYNRSDKALYQSKYKGKDTFFII